MSIPFTLLNKVVLICAKRNSGKSVLLKELINAEKHRFSKIFVISPTEQINSHYSSGADPITTPDCVFNEYSEEWADKLIDKMTAINAHKPPNEQKHVLLVMDDLIADHNFHSSPSLKRLFIRSRHICIALCCTSQYLNTMPPLQRNNCDFILCGQMNSRSVDLLCDEFLSGGLARHDFVKQYHEQTKNWGFILINNNSVKTHDLNEIYGNMRLESLGE